MIRSALLVPIDCSPERLMQLVRQGSGEALDQITRCYSERLLAAGRRHCRTASEAEDAVQDALVSAADALPNLRDDQRLPSFLVKVVASACRRISRGQKNATELHESAAELRADGDPERDTERRELAGLLEQALLGLAPQDRTILLLAELEGFSAAEIGAELGMSDAAVRTRLSRLRTRLAETLKKNLPDL
jgi:RNA polymerase sigma-70 factor (ECF subfamily)